MLQPTGLAVLHQLGLDRLAMASGQRIDRLRGEAEGRIVLDVRYSSLRASLFGIGIDRPALFSILYDALLDAGVEVATGHEIRGLRSGAGAYLTFTHGADEGPFDLIVDALGIKGCLAAETGRELAYGALWTTVPLAAHFDPHALSQRYRHASIMAGVLPTGRSSADAGQRAAFFWSLRAQDYPVWRENGLDRWKEQVRELWPATQTLLDEIHSAESLTFARYAHKTLRRPVSERLIHIGDSWHSASPQLGQGANMALLDAYALAIGLRGARNLADGLAAAAAMRSANVRLYQLLTALLTPVYQSDSNWIPFIRDRLMGPASKLWPFTALQAALVSGLVGSPLRRLGIDFAPSQSAR